MRYECRSCGKEFEAKRRTFVCGECRISGATCLECGKPIPYNRKFCSHSCNSRHNATTNNPMNNLENREKIRATKLLRYGEQYEEAKRKRKEAWEAGKEQRKEEGIRKWRESIAKNGSKLGLANQAAKERVLAKARLTGGMGLANPANKKKAQKTMQERYGVDNAAKDPEVRKKISDKLKVSCIAPEVRNKQVRTLLERYGVTNAYHVGIEDREEYHTSKPETEIADYLRSIGVSVKRNDHSVLRSRELDIYCPKEKIAIEYNGTYWHSSTVKTDKLYHYNKTKACRDRGVKLIHIYEWEWRDEVKKNILKSYLSTLFGKTEDRIYARQCEVRTVPVKEYRDFCLKNHLQGYRAASLVYGLYYQDNLVQLMSFNKPQKRNAKYDFQWEIVRGCPGSNNIVIGGVSKLWNHFLRTNKPESVMSYCDLNKFDGKSYELIGMKLHHIEKPNQFMVDVRTGKVQQWIFRDKEKREDQMNNTLKIYGVGNALYQWRAADEDKVN